MITDEQQTRIMELFFWINPKTETSIQNYTEPDQCRYCHVIRYLDKKKKCVAIWQDFPKLNEWQLRILFKHHKEIDHEFYISGRKDFYRVGWKSK